MFALDSGCRQPLRSTRRRLSAALITLALVATGCVALAVVTPTAADASGLPTAQATVPSAVPTSVTPNITDGVVFGIAQVGSTVILGGNFTGVQDHASSTTLQRSDVLAFDASTGQVSSTFAPTLNGQVNAVAPGPVANTVYLGGSFTTVNGTSMRDIALLNTQTGAIVSGFKPAAFNGAIDSLALGGGHLYAGGIFTTVAGVARGGLVSLNPSTGKDDNFASLAFAGHHNYNGSGSKGGVGPRSVALNPAATRLMVVGNFTTVNGTARDQIAMIDVDGSSAALDTNWATLKYTARCFYKAYDTYVTDVQWSPDGSYFAVSATGGSGTNTDGSRSLCDSASRWSASDSGTNITPTWVDYTGQDTLWTIAVTGSAIYVGGHERWLNNANGYDAAGAGAVPRPGLAALDPVSGVPLTWNPGRNPRGAGAYAILATSDALYVGSDTDYIGNYQYKRQKIAQFLLAGGYTPASTSVASLPANLYLAGMTNPPAGVSTDDLAYRPMSTTKIGDLATVANTGVAWSATRGTFAIGTTLFVPNTNGSFSEAAFDGTTLGTPSTIDPYDDPYWAGVKTGSGSSVYTGTKPSYYSQLSTITGEFYTGGKLYYTLSGSNSLHWRWFSPDSGIVGATDNTVTWANGQYVAGMTISGSTVYFARTDGTLHTETLTNGVPDTTTDNTVSGPSIDGRDWRARSLFLFGPAAFPNQAPTANATVSCQATTCGYDGTSSSDPDGTVASYAWDFGDGSTGTGATTTHTYRAAGTYTVTLQVTDNRGGGSANTWSKTITVTAPVINVGFAGQADSDTVSASPSVTVPAGAAAGTTELLFLTANTAGVTTSAPTGLTGWTQLARQTSDPLETTVWQRTATAGDAGKTVTVPLASSVASDLQLLVYSGVSGSGVTIAGTTDKNTATHTTPAATVTAPNSWVLSYWAQRVSSTSTWTTPSGLAVRASGAGSRANHIDTVSADTNATVDTGSYPAQPATAGVVGGKGATFSVVLPVAAG